MDIDNASATKLANITDRPSAGDLNDSDSEFLAALDQVFTSSPAVTEDIKPANPALFALAKEVTVDAVETGLANFPASETATETINNADNVTRVTLKAPPVDENINFTSTNKQSITPFSISLFSISFGTILKTLLAIHTNILEKSKNIIENSAKFVVKPIFINIMLIIVILWQINELLDRTFRLELLNKTTDIKLAEITTRIDILKNTMVGTERRLQLLEQNISTATNNNPIPKDSIITQP